MGVVSGTGAAALWHLPLDSRRLTNAISVTRASAGRPSKGLEFRRSALEDDDIAEVAGIRLTSITRTLRDLAIALPIEESFAAMNAARRHGHDFSALRNYEGEAAARIRWLLNHAHDRSDSLGESLFDYRLLMEGLALPLRQPSVSDVNGTFLARPDLLWETGAIHEFDGTAKWFGADGTADVKRIRQAQRRAADLEAASQLISSRASGETPPTASVVAGISICAHQFAISWSFLRSMRPPAALLESRAVRSCLLPV